MLGGFRSNQQLVEHPVGLPDPWVTSNYTDTLTNGEFWRQVGNSMLIALLTTALVLPAASLAAFVIARYPFRGREFWYVTVHPRPALPDRRGDPAAVRHAPPDRPAQHTARRRALPQAAFGLPIAIVIMRPFFRAIPKELQDAASIDGCGPLRFYWSIMLPAVAPGAEHDRRAVDRRQLERVLPAAARAHRPDQHTLPIGVNNISTQYSTDFALVLAYTTLSMIPALLFYALAERQIIGGLTAGAVKD